MVTLHEVYLAVKLLLDTALYSLHRDGIFSSEITVICSKVKKQKKSHFGVFGGEIADRCSGTG